jgi:hypothetical protein
LQCHAACWCCRWLYHDVCTWPWQTTLQAFNSNGLHWLYYMILSPEAGVPQCPCYTAWTDPPYGMATSCCMVLYILRTPHLTEPFNTSVCWCVYQVKHKALPFRRPQQCLELWFPVVHAPYHTQYLVCEKSEILLKCLVWFPRE